MLEKMRAAIDDVHRLPLPRFAGMRAGKLAVGGFENVQRVGKIHL
jgi:hypothetical protein